VLIKFNNIRDLSDARYAAAMMAEWIGFTVGEADSLGAAKIQEIIGWCAGPKLILELADSVVPSTLESYMDVLPVDGLELSEDLFNRLQTSAFPAEFIYIFRNAENAQTTGFTHSEVATGASNHILRIKPSAAMAGDIQNHQPFAISLDCYTAENPALKNYDSWNDFFDVLNGEL
jgi:hypothetical protein